MAKRRFFSISNKVIVKDKANVTLEADCVLTPDTEDSWVAVTNISQPDWINFREFTTTFSAKTHQAAREVAIDWLKRCITEYLQSFNHPTDFSLQLGSWRQEPVG